MSEEYYKASAWGTIYHSLTVDEALGAGAAGPGKSWVLLMDPIHQVMVEHQRCVDPDHKYPLRPGGSSGRALHLRRTRPQLTDTIDRAKRVFPAIDPKVVWNENSLTFTFSSGYKYEFSHCANRDDWQNFLSREFTYIGFDELVQFEEEQYDQITSRIRSADPVLCNMLKVRAMSNPTIVRTKAENFTVNDPNWVRRRFVEPAPEGKVILKKKLTRRSGETAYKTRIYLPAKLHDNPDPEFVRNYELTLLNKPPHIRKAMLEGDWWVTAGSYYAESWDERLHVIKPFRIPADWPKWRSMDWGFKAPGCIHWWTMDEDGDVYCIKEFTFQNMLSKKVAQRAKDYEIQMGLWDEAADRSMISGPADDQLWEMRGDSSRSKYDDFADVGVAWVKAYKRSRVGNSNKFVERLLDHNHGTQRPGVMFFNTCDKAITTIPGIQTDLHDAEVPADGGDDHWHDSVLYSMAHCSHGKSSIVMRYPKEDWEVDEHYSSHRKKRGKFGYG